MPSWRVEKPLWLLVLWTFGGTGLKLTGTASIPWWVVVAPFLATGALAVMIVLLFFAVVRFGGRLD